MDPLLFKSESFHWEQDFSWLPMFFVYNSLLQIPVWYFCRKSQWSFFYELCITHFNCVCVVGLAILLDVLLGWASHMTNLLQELSIYFIAFFSVHIIAFVWGEFITNIVAKDVPFFSPRVKEPSLMYAIGQEIIQSLVDVAGYAFFLRISPFDLNKSVGVPPTYIELLIGTCFLFPLPDGVFYFCHGVMLHGRWWSFHRGHHTIYKPTVRSARKFDPFDWFMEATLATLANAIALNFLLLKVTGNYCRFFFLISYCDAGLISMIHHCGKNVPCALTSMMPVTELIPLCFGTTIIEMHEGHHNWVNKNLGVVGFWDYFLDTLAPPKRSKIGGGASIDKPKKE